MTGPLYEALRAHLAATDWPITEDPDHDRIGVAMVGDSDTWPVEITAREERSQVVVLSLVPVVVPHERREAVALALTRINADLVLGSFDFDLDEGLIRFRMSLDTGGEPLTDALIRPLLLASYAQVGGRLEELRRIAA